MLREFLIWFNIDKLVHFNFFWKPFVALSSVDPGFLRALIHFLITLKMSLPSKQGCLALVSRNDLNVVGYLKYLADYKCRVSTSPGLPLAVH